MKVLSAKVNWMLNFANDPRLEIEVDELPSMSSMVYQKKGYLYWAEKDGYVSFFAHDPQHEAGFGGAIFKLNMNTGETVSLKGPWSSRSGYMNGQGFRHSLEVSCKDRKTRYNLAVAITLTLAQEVLKEFCPGVTLHIETDRTDIRYTPTLQGMSPEESKEHLRKK